MSSHPSQVYLTSGRSGGDSGNILLPLRFTDDTDGVNVVDDMTVKQYQVQWLSEFFHSFPHMNLSFQLINPTFDPYNSSYQESLMFIASVPLLWMLLTMLVFIVYFCYMCFTTSDDDKKQKSSKCLRWTIAVLAVLTCGCIGVGLHGNEEAARGMKAFTKTAMSETSDWDSTMKFISSKVSGALEVTSNVTDRIPKLEQQIERAFNSTISIKVKQYTTDITRPLKVVKERLTNIEKNVMNFPDVTNSLQKAAEYEFYRWICTLVLLCYFLFVCLLYLAALAKGSKCLIIFCTCMGVFCLILSWMVIGVYLATAVTVGDFCVDPNAFVLRETSGKINPELINYYTNCSNDITSPFNTDLHEAYGSVYEADRTLRDLDKFAGPLLGKNAQYKKARSTLRTIRRAMTQSVRLMQRLVTLFSCTAIHQSYVTALEGVCHTELAGVALLLLANLVIATLFTFIIVLASVLWRRLGESSSCTIEDGAYTRRHEVAARREFTWHFPPPDRHGHNGDLYTNRKSYSTIDADDDPLTPRPQNSPSYHRYGSLNDVVSAYPSYTAHHASPDQTSGGRFSPPSLRMPGSTRHTGPEHLPLQGTQTPPPAFEAKDTTLQYGDYYEEYHHGLSGTMGSRSGRRDPNGPIQV